MPNKSALSINDLSFSFGSKKVFSNISLQIEPGTIFALIGPNGAGKSTLLRILSGLLPLTSGEITLSSYSFSEQPESVKAHQLLIPDNPDIYPFLTGREFIFMVSSLREISQKVAEKELKKQSNLFPHLDLDARMSDLSRGNKQKVHILTAFIVKPDVLIFDEPIVGLDPLSIQTLGESLKEFTSKKNRNGIKPSVLIALHTLDFAQKFADTVGVLSQGKLTKTTEIGKTDLEKLYKKHAS